MMDARQGTSGMTTISTLSFPIYFVGNPGLCHSGSVLTPEARRLLVDSILRFDIVRRNIHQTQSAESNQWCTK